VDGPDRRQQDRSCGQAEDNAAREPPPGHAVKRSSTFATNPSSSSSVPSFT
jgi:hypothetical protein